MLICGLKTPDWSWFHYIASENFMEEFNLLVNGLIKSGD